MKITLCGSMSHESKMSEVAEALKKSGYEVEQPHPGEPDDYAGSPAENAKVKRDYMDAHFRKIDGSDAILAVNEEKRGVPNYIGGNTLMEIAYAYSQGLDIFLLNSIPEEGFADEVRGVHAIALEGNLGNIDTYVESLPKLLLSSTSPVKRLAFSRALRRAGIPVSVHGREVSSGVNEQPLSIDESYHGATNRHLALKALSDADDFDYYGTAESGFHEIHAGHNTFGCDVVILEKKGDTKKVGIDIDLEFPKEMTDKVPSVYPDMGILVQQEYGSVLKDPFPYISNGKLTRAKIIEEAVYKVAIQLAN